VAIEEGTAERLELRVGSTVELLGNQGAERLRVAAIISVPPAQQVLYHIVLPCSAFEGAEAIYYGGVDLAPSDLPRVRRLIRSQIPELMTADASDLVQWNERLGAETARAVRFCAILISIAAMCLLLGLTRALRFFRMHDVAVLRALGARPRTILVALLVEYGALGGLAGLIGVVLGTGATIAVLFFVTGSIYWTFHAPGAIVLVLLTVLIAAGTGIWGARAFLGGSPLQTLRRS
jgi:putative ABC transport system permease protein